MLRIRIKNDSGYEGLVGLKFPLFAKGDLGQLPNRTRGDCIVITGDELTDIVKQQTGHEREFLGKKYWFYTGKEVEVM